MNFTRSARRSIIIRPVHSDLKDLYPLNLQFYQTPPSNEVSLLELEDCCAQRLAILQTLDEVTNRGLKGEDWRTTVFAELRKQDLKGFRKLITNTSCNNDQEIVDMYDMRKWDHISHFILRLAYCDTEDKRRWFISREVELFRFRWFYLSSDDRQLFLETNNFRYEKVQESEKGMLVKISEGMIQTNLTYYKVPFVVVSDLVRMRKVFISKGIAYIGSEDMIYVIISTFRSTLSRNLAYISRKIDDISEDVRILSLIKGAGKTQRDVDYTANIGKGHIDINNLDSLAEISYPLCMQTLHKKLRKEHHLKHFARLQYILFLKGIGVTLEDALRFWRSEFTKKMDADKFDKAYAYNVRHSYGKAGKMANYSPQSCLKIINASVAAGEAHGCPFRHQDPNSLKKLFQQNGLSTFDAQEILDFVKKGHFQIACGIYFQKKHGVETVVVNHPNFYFDESQMVLNNKAIKKEPKAETRSLPSSARKEEDVWGNDSEFDFSSINDISTI